MVGLRTFTAGFRLVGKLKKQRLRGENSVSVYKGKPLLARLDSARLRSNKALL